MPSQTKKITFDTAALFSGKLIGLLLGMVRLNYLTTYLGVANFGILNFALYFCSLFQVLFDLGMSQLLIRDLARDLSRSREFVGKIALLKTMIVFFAGIIVGAISFASRFESQTNWAILLTTVVFSVNGLSVVFLSAFQAHRKMTIVSVSNIFNDLILSVLIILIVKGSPHVVTVLLLGIFVSSVNLLVLYVLYRREVGAPEFSLDKDLWKSSMKEAVPMAVSSFGISTYTFIGSTVLGYCRGDVEVGIYSAGYKIISILTLIPLTFSQVVYPIFSDFSANAVQKLKKALQDSSRVMTQISIPLATGTVILAPKIISFLYPAAFEDAASVLRIIICGEAFVYLAWIIYAFLMALNHQKLCMRISLAVAFVSLAANLLLVPTFGYRGVAFILFSTDLILFASYSYFAAREGYSVIQGRHFLKIIASSGVMGAVLFFIKEWYLVPTVLVGSCVYFAALFALRGFGDQEREFLAKILKR